jgi:hypothetical protein
MAQKVLVQLVDDLDGTTSDSVTTVQFGLDGVMYEIDLTDSNADRLRGVFADYVNSGRRTGGRVKRGSAARNGSGGSNDAGQIREWAQANGIELAARGRIPAHVAESYRQAQSEEKAKVNGSAKRRPRTKKS